jgi:zinc protease
MRLSQKSMVWLSLVLLVFAVETQALGLEMRDKILPNGLRVVVAENHNAPVFTMRVYIRAGSDYEAEYVGSGISHLIEHLVSSGTTSVRTEAENNRILTAIGGAYNAYTSPGHACYFIETSIDFADSVLSLLPDWVLNCSIAPDEYEREKGVILREIQMGRDEPLRRLSKLYNGTMFVRHPEHFPAIGYPELFEKITRDDVVKHYERMYVPANMYAIAVGDFDADQMMARVEEAFSKYPYERPFSQVLPSDPKQMGRKYVEDEMDIDLSYMTMGFRVCMLTDNDTYPLQVLARILGDGRSSRLYREVKDRQGLVHTISTSAYNAEYDASDFTVYTTMDYDKSQAAIDAILAVIYDLKHSLVTRKEIEKAVTQMTSEYAFGFQAVEDQAGTMGSALVRTGNPRYDEVFLAKIAAVTPEDIRRVVNKYFNDDAATIAVLKPTGATATKSAEVAQAGAAAPATKTVLANGATLLQKADYNVPLVHFRACFHGGSRLEDAQTNGAFNLMARMMRRGTRTRSAEKIAAEMDGMGGSLALGSAEDYFYCNMDILSENFDRGLEILADLVTNSTFDPDQFEKEREVVLAEILQRADDWQSDGEARMRKVLYGDHAYAFDPLGEEASVKSLTAAYVRDLYLKYCAPRNLVLAVYGDVDPAYAREAVAKALGRFDREGVAMPPPEIWQGIDRDIVVTEPTDKEQAVIFMGYPGMDLGSPDWYATRVLDAITSGIGYPGGWLHESLRGQRLVYIVHAWNYALPERGYFAVMAATSPATADSALAIIRDKMAKAKNEYVTDAELAMGKRICNVMEDVSYAQTTADQANLATQYEIVGLGYNYRDNLREKINAVTKEDVRRVAQKYLTKSATLVIRP